MSDHQPNDHIPIGTRVYLLNVDDWLTADHFFHVPASHTNGKIVAQLDHDHYTIISDAGKRWTLHRDHFMIDDCQFLPSLDILHNELIHALLLAAVSILIFFFVLFLA